MSVNDTSICNLALSRFGGGSITSLDDGSEAARLLQINYDNCLENVLRAFPWAFANYIDSLELLDETTPGYDYVYLYPTQCAKVLRVCDEDSIHKDDWKNEYKIITNGNLKLIASNIQNAFIVYTYRVTDTSLYDSMFVKALSYMLASEICNAKTGNSATANEMLQKYQLAIVEARQAAATEANVQQELPTSYVRGRR